MIWHRWIQTLTTLVVVAGLGACNVTLRPTRPDQPLTAGAHVAGVRFAPEDVEIRETGMPLSTSRSWDREVQNYTATQLNLLLSTDPVAPSTRTIVYFDSAPPPSFEFGSWREMTVELTSILPNGETVRSKPVTGFIDSAVEQFGVQCLGIAGSVLDVAASLAGLIYVFSSTDSELACGLFAGALIGGLTLNLAQNAAGHWSKLQQQTRWSNLFADALTAHAEDIRRSLGPNTRKASPAPPPALEAPAAPDSPPPPAGAATAPPPPAVPPPSPPPADIDDLPPPAPLSFRGGGNERKVRPNVERTAY